MKLNIEGRTRKDILDAALSSGKIGAHIAPSLSLVEISLAILNRMSDGDKFVLSKGHGALGYYAAMHQVGLINDRQFSSFESNGGEFPGQPSRNDNNHVDYSSGSLGMGLSYALGAALGIRDSGGRVFVVLGDGELNEGSNWEAAALANQYRLDNLIAVVDNNNLQSDGLCKDIMDQDLPALWKAYGWHVEECDGHSVNEILNTMDFEHPGKPLVILARTIKGKGVSFMENNNAWHHAVLKDNDYREAVREIEDIYGIQ